MHIPRVQILRFLSYFMLFIAEGEMLGEMLGVPEHTRQVLYH